MDTMTLMRLRAAQSNRTSNYGQAGLRHYPARTVPPLTSQQTVQPTPQPDAALTQLVDLGLRTVVPVQYQIVKTGGEVLESPSVPDVVKVLVGLVVGAAVISAGNEIGRTIDNLLS